MNIINEDKKNICNTYNRFEVVLTKGSGSILVDENGKEYIDFSSGIGTNIFGIDDKVWVDAVTSQANTIQHASNLYYTKPQVELAKLLCEKTGMKKVFFSNSGAESNECAIKTARKYSFDKYGEDRYEIITLVNSFHGRTIATLSATGQDVFHQYFMPFVDGFKYVHANDIEELDKTISNKTCAIMIETIQGEGGVNALDEKFIKHIDKVCKEKDLVFIVDEVQTGNGRTGYFYSYMEYGVTPDVVTTAKGIGGGLPLGAVLFSDKVKDTLGFGQHGTTFGGNPICTAGAYTIVERIDDKLLEHVRECNKIIKEKLLNHKNIVSISGKGLMIGIEIKEGLKSSDIVKEGIEKGVIMLTAKNKVRLLPALNIPFDVLEKGLDILLSILEEK